MKTTMMLGVLVVMATACGSAQVVRRDATSGQLVLHGSYMLAMRDARSQMGEQCGKDYQIAEELGTVTFACSPGSKAHQVAALQLPTR